MTSSSFSELFCISTHALTEGDIAVGTEVKQTSIFQLTPSRRATPFWNRQGFMHQHFNSRPHGGRHFLIYLLRLLYHFNSRPHGGRQNIVDVSKNIRVISTHALTEGDERDFRGRSERKHFNSRPHGGRLSITGDSITSTSFQLTPSRRATKLAYMIISFQIFQLTPSRRATIIMPTR